MSLLLKDNFILLIINKKKKKERIKANFIKK